MTLRSHQAATAEEVGAMVYEDHHGLQVATSGPVVIDGVLHRVEARFVVCEPTLNRRPWGFAEFATACPICYPGAAKCTYHEYVQAEFWGE